MLSPSEIDDEPLTDEDYELFLECKAALANGDPGSSMEEVMAELGLKPEDVTAPKPTAKPR